MSLAGNMFGSRRRTPNEGLGEFSDKSLKLQKASSILEDVLALGGGLHPAKDKMAPETDFYLCLRGRSVF